MPSNLRPGHRLGSSLMAGGGGLRAASNTGVLALSSVPTVLRPALRAFLFGYASAVGPRLLTLIVQHLSRKRKRRWSQELEDNATLLESALHIVRTGFDVQRFPTFCAVLAGGSTILLKPVKVLIDRFGKSLSSSARLRVARWLASFISAWLGLKLLHSKGSTPHNKVDQRRPNGAPKAPSQDPAAAGRTMDLTLFTVTRALDVLVGELWAQHRARRIAGQKWTRVEHFAGGLVDPAVFVVSCGFIMWSWFFFPDRLPRSYNKWITSAASVDLRLIEALRRCKFGDLRYGEDTGLAPLLGSMCHDYGLPRAWGDPAKAIPFPCEIVHMGCGSSCEYHALQRFVRSWKWSMYTYLPLALAVKMRKPSGRSLVKAILSASRSSAFLGVFITLFYYGVCLARTRVGPHVLGKDAPSCQRIDGGICVATGCSLCGWSVLIETASRRKDMAMFVAPRALATVLPRRYPKNKQWQETLVFASSAAVIVTCILENPKRVRGVFGGLLNTVMRV